MMRKCCCFCGKEMKEFPQYILTIQKCKKEDELEETSQELVCHEECLQSKLFDEKWLYLKYI